MNILYTVILSFLFCEKKIAAISNILYHVFWRFSFTLRSNGEVSKVFYPPDENENVLKVKKGFAAMLGSKLHREEEVRKPYIWCRANLLYSYMCLVCSSFHLSVPTFIKDDFYITCCVWVAYLNGSVNCAILSTISLKISVQRVTDSNKPEVVLLEYLLLQTVMLLIISEHSYYFFF